MSEEFFHVEKKTWVRVILPVLNQGPDTIADSSRSARFYCACKNREFYSCVSGDAAGNVEVLGEKFSFKIQVVKDDAFISVRCYNCRKWIREKVTNENVTRVKNNFVFEVK